MYGIIYKAVCPMGKVYVGQTVKSLAMRKGEHKFRAKKGDRRAVFQVALLEHGVDSFQWEQIDIADTVDELDQKEKYWIAHFDSMNPEKGYNTFEGGKGAKHTVESRRKIGFAQKGERHHMYGKRHTVETRNKMSKAQKGENNPMFGKSHSLEARLKMRGENNQSSKLTEAQVKEIKTALAKGERQRVLAKKYEVSQAVISKIKLGRKWTHA